MLQTIWRCIASIIVFLCSIIEVIGDTNNTSQTKNNQAEKTKRKKKNDDFIDFYCD